MTTRTLLYARYSSDQQNPRSAEDQLAAMRQALRERGWTEVAAFKDEEISGAAMGPRTGVQAMMRQALAGGVDVVMVEALDRLSRGQADTMRLYELLDFAGVRLETLSRGLVDETGATIEGLFNRRFLVDLGKKTRRGQVAKVRAGSSGGGRCYGYDTTAIKGELVINAAHASVIRRIFADYVAGRSPGQIAKALNQEGVAPPRAGGAWRASTIQGDAQNGDGILHQRLYVAERVYGRRRWRKHPETGARSSLPNPPADWIREPAPQLRILDDEIFAAAAALHARLSHRTNPEAARRPRRLLSGLIACAACGGPMVITGSAHDEAGGQRYACSARREDKAACPMSAHPPIADVEARVLTALRTRLLRPEFVAEVMRQVHLQEHQARQTARASLSRLEGEAAELERRWARILDAYESGAIDKALLAERLAPLKPRRAELTAQLATAREPDEPPIALHPTAPARYRDLVDQLGKALAGDDAHEIRQALRPLIHHLDVDKGDKRGAYKLTLSAKAKALLAEPEGPLLSTLGAGAGFGRYDDSPVVEIAA